MIRITCDLGDLIGVGILVLIGLFWGGICLYEKTKEHFEKRREKHE